MGQPNTYQTNVGTSPTAVATSPGGCLTIFNLGTQEVFFGGSSVSLDSGIPLPGVVGACLKLESCDDWYAISAVATRIAIIVGTPAGLFFLVPPSSGGTFDEISEVPKLHGVTGNPNVLAPGLGQLNTKFGSAQGGGFNGVYAPPVGSRPGYFEIGAASVVGGMAEGDDSTTTGLVQEFRCKIAMDSSGGMIFDNNCWIGLVPVFSITGIGPSTFFAVAPPTPFIGMKWRQDSDGANWQLYVSLDFTGLNFTKVDTGVPAVSGVVGTAGTFVDLRMVFRAGGTAIDFYVNGSFITTITSNIPPDTQGLCAVLYNESISRARLTGVQVQRVWFTSTV